MLTPPVVTNQRISDETPSPLRRSGRKRKLNYHYSPDFAAGATLHHGDESIEGHFPPHHSHRGSMGDIPKGTSKLRRKPLFLSSSSHDLPPRHGIGLSSTLSSSGMKFPFRHPNSPNSSPLSQRFELSAQLFLFLIVMLVKKHSWIEMNLEVVNQAS